MDLLTFVSEVIASIAPLCGSCIWPVTVLLLVLILKNPLLALLKQVRGLKFGDILELDLVRTLEEKEQKAEQAGGLPPPTSEFEARIQELRKLGSLGPRGAIIESWLMVDASLRDLAEAADIPAEHVPVPKLLTQLQDEHVIIPELASLIEELKHGRDLAVREPLFEERGVTSLPTYLAVTVRVLESLDVTKSSL